MGLTEDRLRLDHPPAMSVTGFFPPHANALCIAKQKNRRRPSSTSSQPFRCGLIASGLTTAVEVAIGPGNGDTTMATIGTFTKTASGDINGTVKTLTFDAVQEHLRVRNSKVTPPRVVSGPTLLTGICFCEQCGGAMTLRTGKGGRYRYYTCSIKARQGETGCSGRSIPMPQLDALVCDHIESRLLQPKRLEEVLASILDRREERADRRREHIAELNRRVAATELRLKRLYEAIESSVADLNDPALKERIVALRALRDQAQVDSERAHAMLESSGSMAVTPTALRKFATTARRRLRQDGGGYRRDHLRAFAQRVEVGEGHVRIVGSKGEPLRALTSVSSGKSAGIGVPTLGLKWRRGWDSNPRNP